MKRLLSVYILAAIIFLASLSSCTKDYEQEQVIVGDGDSEVSLRFLIDTHGDIVPMPIASRAPSYIGTINHMRILAFNASTGVLFKQIVIPSGANPPTKLRLPWGKYYLVFAGNFTTLNVSEGVTTLNDAMVSMTLNTGSSDICTAPTIPYYYYKTGIVQFGIVANIPVTLVPVTSQLIFNYQNKPDYYTTIKADIRNIGQTLSLQGTSLAPIVRVIKTRSGLPTTIATVIDTTYTFASIGSLPYIRLYATDTSNKTDSLDFTLRGSIMTGKAYKINFIFPTSPILPASANGNRLSKVTIRYEEITSKHRSI